MCNLGLLFRGVTCRLVGEGGTLASVAWDIFKAGNAKGVGAFGALSNDGWHFADALA